MRKRSAYHSLRKEKSEGVFYRNRQMGQGVCVIQQESVREQFQSRRCGKHIIYNTYIGENGSELSGGERQRISIARAFLKDAPVILLDEATASLDAENETAIQEALSRLIKNKTVMIIAHRMRTIANADNIVVLKDGVVAEQGSPEQLSASDSIYSRMTRQQLITQNWKM